MIVLAVTHKSIDNATFGNCCHQILSMLLSTIASTIISYHKHPIASFHHPCMEVHALHAALYFSPMQASMKQLCCTCRNSLRRS